MTLTTNGMCALSGMTTRRKDNMTQIGAGKHGAQNHENPRSKQEIQPQQKDGGSALLFSYKEIKTTA